MFWIPERPRNPVDPAVGDLDVFAFVEGQNDRPDGLER